MRTRSETWIDIVRKDFLMDARIEADGVIYSRLTAPRIDRALMSEPLSVGNCVSATLDVSILTGDVLNAKTPIVVKGRVMNPTRTRVSEALPFGTFYINKRAFRNGFLVLQCYDAMLKANQPYLSADDDGSGWPKFMTDVVAEIAYRLGVGIDKRTLVLKNDAYIVSCPTDLTMRQVLGYIGACMGGNWIITEENMLRLVPLNNIPGATVSTELMSNAVTPDSTINGYTFHITDELGRPLVTKDGFYLVWADDQYVTAETGLVEAQHLLGSYDFGEAIVVTGVEMTDSDGNTYTAGETSGEGVIRVENNPYANQFICDDLWSRYKGLVYAPYTANRVVYDPAAELGDQITIKDKISSVLYTSTLTFDVLFSGDLSAPSNEELSVEYPYLTEFKRLNQSTTDLRMTIEKTAEELEKLTESNGTDLAGLTAALTQEIERASGIEADLADRLSQEENRAKGAEQALQQLIERQAATINELLARVAALDGGRGPDDGTDTGGGEV